jgi:hypothetical protein
LLFNSIAGAFIINEQTIELKPYRKIGFALDFRDELSGIKYHE